MAVPSHPEADPFAAWRNAPTADRLDEASLLDAISVLGDMPRQRQMYLRMQAWWCHNDCFRSTDSIEPPIPDGAARENAERLFELLDPGRHAERRLRADIARMLGRFDVALDLVDGDDDWPRRLGVARAAARARFDAIAPARNDYELD